MKKISSIIVFILAFGQVSAQFGALSNKSLYVGIRGGANFSQIQTTDLKINRIGSSLQDFWTTNATNRTGYVIGAYARIGRKLHLQPEILLSTKGGTINVLKSGTTSPVNVDVKFSQIDIPVLVGYKVGPIRVNVGPLASLNVSQGTALGDALKLYSSQAIEKTIQQATFGYQAGVGFDLGSFNLDLRREGSLSNVSQLNLQNNAQFNSKVSLWQLSFGMVLF